MQFFTYALIFMFCLDSVLSIGLIGVERKPRSKIDAIITIAINAIIIIYLMKYYL